mmetsp:Transcript_51381/g.130655  ORF Transcript_51381/g.130655 Transcript_51381/m.130655 type:complete len:121 (-) Transcript_51381:13-375(-)
MVHLNKLEVDMRSRWSAEQERLAARRVDRDELDFTVAPASAAATCARPPAAIMAAETAAAGSAVHSDLPGDATVGVYEIRGLERLAGVDLSFFPDNRHAVAAVVVLSFPSLEAASSRGAL